jgi:hypothetical protein
MTRPAGNGLAETRIFKKIRAENGNSNGHSNTTLNQVHSGPNNWERLKSRSFRKRNHDHF